MTIVWKIVLSKQASTFLNQQNAKMRARLDAALGLLADDPRSGKMLAGDLKGYWSFRVGNYRIIYSIDNGKVWIEILRISHRKEVYERFRR